ncbi:CPBP family intramembrane glutamic endopeptidase [Alkalihalobacterium bogoriense]|uniref:CPBP family intramembrane glutamic endopeptidase n=1 Tax=Alkalihalobacterium bogoriense TaxID=246272 RepID=UPI00047D2F10|nr:type II CAAX endopeptidase family protein [Alkalihalobacterium bogoriense]
MLHIVKTHKYVVIIAIIALFVNIGLFFIPGDGKHYSYPEMDRAEVKDMVDHFLDEMNVTGSTTFMVESSNADIRLSKYLENEVSKEEFETIKDNIPLYTMAVHIGEGRSVHIDPVAKQIVGTNSFAFPILDGDVEAFVQDFFNAEYTLLESERFVPDQLKLDAGFLSLFTDHTRYTFEGLFQLGELQDIVTVEVGTDVNGTMNILGVMQSAEVSPQYMAIDKPGDSLIDILLQLAIVVLIIGGIGIAVFVHFIVRACQKKVAFWLPLGITFYLMAFSMVFSYVYMGNLGWLSLIDSLITSVLVLFILMITIPKDTADLQKRPLKQKASLILDKMKMPIVIGLCFAVIMKPIADLFFWVGSMFADTWFSPVTFYEIYLVENIWLLPFFALSIGITAAIMEETVFRRYLASVMDKIHPIFAVLVSSFLWAVLHLGYDVFPWYLRIIELTLIIGPVLYWIYKRYGFLTAIYCHYFYNSLLTSVGLLYFKVDVAIVAILLTLSPLLLVLIRTNKSNIGMTREEKQEAI